jgi:hypothetical protein
METCENGGKKITGKIAFRFRQVLLYYTFRTVQRLMFVEFHILYKVHQILANMASVAANNGEKNP